MGATVINRIATNERLRSVKKHNNNRKDQRPKKTTEEKKREETPKMQYKNKPEKEIKEKRDQPTYKTTLTQTGPKLE